MSKWTEITNIDDIEIDSDDVNIFYGINEFGNKYIHFKRDLIEKFLEQNINEERYCGNCCNKDELGICLADNAYIICNQYKSKRG